MSANRLSIIVPIYNSERYVTKCLESIISCPIQDMECILVNDGSVDNSINICKRYIENDNRINLINTANQGVSVARNVGMSAASGTHILFIDADDYLEQSSWSSLLKAVESGYDFTAFSYFTLNADGSVVREGYPIKEKQSENLDDVYQILLSTPLLNTCWGKILRADIIRKNAIAFPIHMKTGEDAVFILDYLKYAEKTVLVNEPVLYYRQHEQSAMRRLNIQEKLLDMHALYESRLSFRDVRSLDRFDDDMYREWFSVITNLFLECAQMGKLGEIKSRFREISKMPMIIEIIKQTPKEKLSPIYKRFEYILFYYKKYLLLTYYFCLKRKFR